ncbi:hypothetical protein TOPH_07115 [Tolypocladium ophioglossoides CBS 100239]|uniref:Uncharacterized protein n=1 Tax=Tolypocladium ophioglossoides (strain CBS 100239) TaxID=1163406 RepID=A0A0L0N344_TOLOC|nr:hypothetical protein TOPH_07115 [Tolypocladium ophioglossoides CBS 100239]
MLLRDRAKHSKRNANSFQQVQRLPALQSSIRFLPHVIMGICVNAATAYLISRVKNQTLAVVSAVITMIAPPLMATARATVLFTVSNLVISNAFLTNTQSLAGDVFSEVSQIGNSVGLAVTAAIAASTTDHSGVQDHREALMEGFRTASWTVYASTAFVVVICFFGLKRGGFFGKKDD